MTGEEAREVSDLLVTLDDAGEWRDSFAECKDPFVIFEEVVHAKNVRGDGTRGGWVGSLGMPKWLALRMMLWLENEAITRLTELGVTNPKGRQQEKPRGEQ